MSTLDDGQTDEIAPEQAWPGEPTAVAVTAVQPAVAPPVPPVPLVPPAPLDERPPPLPPRAPLWPWGLAAALLLFVAALLVWLLVFHGRSSTSSPRSPRSAPAPATARTQRVPNLVGQMLPAAQRQARQLRLLPVIVRRSSSRPSGLVLAELPAPGTLVKPGAPVTLTVSAGTPAAAVPDVVGLTAPAAARKLRAGGFEPRLVTVPSRKPAGTVLRQQPAKVRPGAPVTLSVSKGPVAKSRPPRVVTVTTVSTTPAAQSPAAQTTAVPRLVGQDLGPALDALEHAGLLAKLVYLTSQQPLGQVIGQNPAAGTPAARQRRIQVNVAEGPNPGNPAQLPDVTGEDAATARADLESAGFQAVVVRTKRTGTSGSVLEQQPAAGATLSTGDIVAIYVP